MTLSVTDESGGGAIYGNISETKSSDASKEGIAKTEKVNGEKPGGGLPPQRPDFLYF